MRPAHLSRLRVRGGNLDDLAILHCEWALGLGRFLELRESRLASGVPSDAWPEDLVGEHGDRWLFRFSLPINGGKRTSAVRVAAVQGGVQVEHLVVHEGAQLAQEPTADAPETVRKLLDLPNVEPAMLRQTGAAVLGERDVAPLVARVLDPRRAAPIVLVSVDNSTREPLVDPHELARRLAGMVEVSWLSTVNASRRLKDDLMARGFSEKFGCFHGGVRILWPGIEKDDNPYDHLLLLPMRLETIAADVRTARVAGTFCEMIAEDEDLRAWLREVEAPLRAEPPRRPAALEQPAAPAPVARASGGIILGQPQPAPPPPPPQQPSLPWRSPLARRSPSESAGPAASAATPPPAVPRPPPELRPEPTPPASSAAPVEPASAPASPAAAPARTIVAEVGTISPGPVISPPSTPEVSPVPSSAVPSPEPAEPATPEVEPTRPRRQRGETHWSRLAGDVAAAAELADELEDELDELRQELAASRKALRRAEQERDDAVDTRFTATTVAEALALAEACFADRLVVLPSARSSAESSPFRDSARIVHVLALLAFFGRHDGDLENALEKTLGAQARWRPRDSPDTTARFGAHRTWFDRSGNRKLFRRHVTLGHGVDPQRCAQIYYDVAPDGRIELAWIGEHRPTVSEDT